MCKLPALLGVLFAAVHATSAFALPPSGPGFFDPLFGEGGASFYKVQPDATGEQIRGFTLIGSEYVTVGFGEIQGVSYAFIRVIDKSGRSQPDKFVSIPNSRLYSVQFVNGKLLAVGRTGTKAILKVLDYKTLQPVPGCGDADGVIGVPGPAGTSTNFVSSFPAGEDRIGAVFVAVNAQNRIAGGPIMWDVANCAPVPTFGSNGFLIVNDFFPGGGAWAGDGGVVAGYYKPTGAANQTGAVFDFNALGQHGPCNGLRTIHAEAGQDVFLNSTVWDPVAQAWVVGGYRSPATTPLIKRIRRSTCAADAATWNWTGTGFVNAMAIEPATAARARGLAIVMNDFSGAPYRTRLVRYPMDGGDPTILPEVSGAFTFFFEPAASDPASVRSGGKAVAATTVTSSIGYAVAVDPDGKLVLAGTADPAGGSALLARYIGVEITSNVIEFYNSGLDHYFITADAAEAAAVDGGAAGPGWVRTGHTWKSGGPDRVCRFYGSPEINPATGLRRGPNSHFYTISADECEAVKQDPGWRFESYDFSGWPKVIDGSCPAGTVAVKRVYNGRFAQNDSNHRYTINDGVYNQMVAMGWSGEGSVFCAVL